MHTTTEERLQLNEERLRLALDAARIGTWEWDMRASILRCNEYHALIWGFPPGTLELSVEELGKRVHPEDRDRITQTGRKAVDTGEDFFAEYRIVWPDRSIHWLQGRGRTQYDASRAPVRMIGTVVDVSAQKEADERERAARAQLQAQADQFRVLIEAIPQIVWTTHADGSVDYFNRHWYEHTGLTETESLGDGWSKAIHPEDIDSLLSTWNHSLKSCVTYEAEARVRHAPDGTYRWMLTRAHPLKDNGGKVLKWFGTCTDIELRKRHADELARSNAELERYAYVASHDLKEPLRMISLYVQLLQDRYRGKLDADADEFIRYAYEGAAQMRALIDDLLAYSRVSRDEKQAVYVDFNAVFSNVLGQLRATIAETGAQVSAQALPVVNGDPGQLAQLLQNLLANSLKFRGPAAPRVLLTAVRESKLWHFKVEDNGIGIQAQYFEKVFGLFQRLHTRKEYPGTGMGLAICKKIVERHGGSIWAESSLGKGSTFHFTLRA